VACSLAADLAAIGRVSSADAFGARFRFLYLFVALAAGTRWGFERSILLAAVGHAGGVAAGGVSGRLWLGGGIFLGRADGRHVHGRASAWRFSVTANRRHAAEHDYLARLTGMLKIEQGVTESLRLMLEELARGLAATKPCWFSAMRKPNAFFAWTAVVGQTERTGPENLPLVRGDAFLLDQPDTSVCWNQMNGTAVGFGWNRHDGRRITELPRMPAVVRQALRLNSILAVTFDFAGQPAGRILLANVHRRCLPQDLQWFERVVRHLAPPLENLFLLRRLRTRAIEGERSRISRDIHDGILQTLLSVDINST